MTIKVYVSGICGSQEVRKQQQRVLFILQSMPIDLQIIDITEPGKDEELTFMQETAKKHKKKTQLPPQIFNDSDYCGDYADFELANDDDDIMKFLKLESGPSKAEILQSGEPIPESITQNGIGSHDNEVSENPATNHVNDVGEDLNAQQNDSAALNSEEKQEVPGTEEPKVSDSVEGKVSEEESEEESE